MIFASLALWTLLVLIAGMALYRWWARLLGGTAIDWILLPATLADELLYSAGLLLTGRPAWGGIIAPRNPDTDPCRAAITSPKGFLVWMLCSLLNLVGCALILGVLTKYLGRPILEAVVLSGVLSELSPDALSGLPRDLPNDWASFWDLIDYQVVLLKRMIGAMDDLSWRTWQTPVFLYASAAFAVRLGPVRHDQRSALLTAGLLLGIIAAIGAAVPAVRSTVGGDVWFLLTYVWGLLLVLLVATAALRGLWLLLELLIPALARRSIRKRVRDDG